MRIIAIVIAAMACFIATPASAQFSQTRMVAFVLPPTSSAQQPTTYKTAPANQLSQQATQARSRQAGKNHVAPSETGILISDSKPSPSENKRYVLRKAQDYR